MGYSLMIWTFDPLESRNTYLDFSKLKGICYIYLKNCYGEMQDGLNKGLPSDRLKLECGWRVKSAWQLSANDCDLQPAVHIVHVRRWKC